MDGVVAAA
jgi:hypothetical protein